MVYERCIRPLLFAGSKDDPEIAHETALRALRFARREPLRSLVAAYTATRNFEREVFGIHFKTPIGFAPGFDKNGIALLGLEALGFGFGELGTVLPRSQQGNPRPRIVRIPEERAIINRMGFNSQGAAVVRQNIATYGMPKIPIGVNVGANKDTPVERMHEDYLMSMSVLYDVASFVVANISSPNTPGLRRLQEPELLENLVRALQERLRDTQKALGEAQKKPLLVKFAPDLTIPELDTALRVVADRAVDGVVIGNTSNGRPRELVRYRNEIGGLSGPPLFAKLCTLVAHVKRQLPKLPVVAVGGIETSSQVYELLDYHGASLVEVYTAFVYQGPMLPSRLANGVWPA